MAETAKDRMRAMRAHGSPTRRKVGEGNPAANGDVGIERKVRITVDLPESLHRALRVRVANEGTDAQTLIRRLLTVELQD
jgi:hypothetical protein